eukprot:gnl/TRDRNA2_/TRDRNA2_179568_c0_seq1.p1 gnl/TRDRNA2_/TRDRNA2_179568_c0~~gnl/TRDRNA2_/TRDRNA2_179568_c0_seq1.p1  ORF type:complete len:680 (-),score=141.71 gnl/TRDRNA2_/TRDRNA2_179568_c0_seq1:121-2070(-)
MASTAAFLFIANILGLATAGKSPEAQSIQTDMAQATVSHTGAIETVVPPAVPLAETPEIIPVGQSESALPKDWEHGILKAVVSESGVQSNSITVKVITNSTHGVGVTCSANQNMLNTNGNDEDFRTAFTCDAAKARGYARESSKSCHVGISEDCSVRGCKVQINGLQPVKTYHVWCIPSYYANDVVAAASPELAKSMVVPPSDMGLKVRTHHVPLGINELHQRVDFHSMMLVSLVVIAVLSFKHRKLSTRVYESLLVVVIGTIIGVTMRLHEHGGSQAFSTDIFTYILLPTVIIAAGVAADLAAFREHLGLVFVLGFIGAIATCATIYFCPGVFTELMPETRFIAAFSLSASDTAASMSLLSAEAFPLVQTVVFAEGVLNNMVSSLLAHAFKSGLGQTTFSDVLINLLHCTGASAMLGLAGALVCKLLCATFAQIGTEKMLSVLLAVPCYGTYFLAERLELSGVCALAVCSVLSAHFARQALSEEANMLSKRMANAVGCLSEALTFSYVGLTAIDTFFPKDTKHFSWLGTMIFAYFAALVVLRFFLVFAVGISLRICPESFRTSLLTTACPNVTDLTLVSLGGLMKGSLTVATVLRHVPDAASRSNQQDAVVSLCLGIVFVHCIAMNIAFPKVVDRLNPSAEKTKLIGN